MAREIGLNDDIEFNNRRFVCLFVCLLELRGLQCPRAYALIIPLSRDFAPNLSLILGLISGVSANPC